MSEGQRPRAPRAFWIVEILVNVITGVEAATRGYAWRLVITLPSVVIGIVAALRANPRGMTPLTVDRCQS